MANLSSGQEVSEQEKMSDLILELKKENEYLKQQNLILQSTLKEINITDIIKILEEHGQDLVPILQNSPLILQSNKLECLYLATPFQPSQSFAKAHPWNVHHDPQPTEIL